MLQWLMGVAMAFAWAAGAQAECRMAAMSHLPLQQSGRLVTVPARFNGHDARLIFDTGAYSSLLTKAAADRMQLSAMRSDDTDSIYTPHNPQALVGGIGGQRAAMWVTARTLELAELHARNYNITAAPIDWSGADGLLSIDMISNFDVDLDFPENQVVLYKPNGDCAQPSAFLAAPLTSVPLLPFGEDRRPRIMVTLDGLALRALIDTGASHTAIMRAAAARLGLDAAASSPDAAVSARGIGPATVQGRLHVFGELDVGDLGFRNKPIQVLNESMGDDVDMLLGADFQRAVHLWVSYSSHTLIMQFPPQPSKKISH